MSMQNIDVSNLVNRQKGRCTAFSGLASEITGVEAAAGGDTPVLHVVRWNEVLIRMVGSILVNPFINLKSC